MGLPRVGILSCWWSLRCMVGLPAADDPDSFCIPEREVGQEIAVSRTTIRSRAIIRRSVSTGTPNSQFTTTATCLVLDASNTR
ncbi:hypothetical protein BKA83DRAFT_4314477 [Pisolithus microcarpus]|nr:hypothetical protein BKA83DRAFT_4314477 [Pisolithus microcarpus]